MNFAESLPEDPRPNLPGDSGEYIFGSDDYNEDVGEQFGGRGSARSRVRDKSISNLEEEEQNAKSASAKRQSLMNYDI